MADGIFGLSEKALQICEERAVLLSNNIVNASTPNYKARDVDFHKLMQENQQKSALNTGTSQPIISPQSIQYRIPMQQSLDGNTVDEEIERKSFIENALRYQVNLTFMKNQSDQIMKSMKGD